mmetsp:Transcript_17618/g.29521  ORF Transcript_17618/g.29521 Transcript_17618/m.29521 type:complete len:560 (-) Transcript_17618:171-1850(-)
MAAARLDQVLSQITYPNRQRVRKDVESLLKEYRSLIPKASDFVDNSGVDYRLLVLAGTVPIFYGGVQYNIPVEAFIPTQYPHEPPKLYVRPTANMTVKRDHHHVTPNGLVSLPYLQEWNPSNETASNLTGLIETSSSVFSIEPPLFAKPPAAAGAGGTSSTGNVTASARSSSSNFSNSSSSTPIVAVAATPTNAATSTLSPYLNYDAGNSSTVYTAAITTNNNYQYNPTTTTNTSPSSSTSSSSNNNNNNNNRNLPTSAAAGVGAFSIAGINAASSSSSSRISDTQGLNSAQPALSMTMTGNSNSNNNNNNNNNNNHDRNSSSSTGEESKRLALVDEATMHMYSVIDMKQRGLRDELDKEFATAAKLENSGEAALQIRSSLNSSIIDYADAIKTMEEKAKELEAYSAAEETKPSLTVVERLVPNDEVSSQIISLSSQVNAIDDAFYYLERALVSHENESVDLNTFLRECRKLARKQFLCKAHLRKVLAVCRQEEAIANADTAAAAAAGAGNANTAYGFSASPSIGGSALPAHHIASYPAVNMATPAAAGMGAVYYPTLS